MSCCRGVDAPDRPEPEGAATAGPAPAAPRKSALAFFVVLLLLLPAGVAAQALARWVGLVWTEVFGFLVPALVAVAGSNLLARRYLGLGRTVPALLVLGGIAGASCTLVAVALQGTLVRFLPPEWLDAFDVSRIFAGPAWERWATAATATFLAPVCEEIAFRGYLLRTLRLRRGVGASIALSAILFGLVHLDPVRLVGLVGLGALFGWLAVRGGSLWPAIAAHAGNNAVVSWVLVSGPPSSSATAVPGALPPTAQLLAASALGLAVLVPVLVAYARTAAGEAPPEPDPLERRDPAVSSVAFHPTRVPPWLRAVVAAGALALAALAASGWLGRG